MYIECQLRNAIQCCQPFIVDIARDKDEAVQTIWRVLTTDSPLLGTRLGLCLAALIMNYVTWRNFGSVSAQPALAATHLPYPSYYRCSVPLLSFYCYGVLSLYLVGISLRG